MLEELTSPKKCRRFSIGNMCVFVSRPIEIVTLRKNGETPNWVVEFLRLKDTFRKKKNMEIVKDLRLQMAQVMECNYAVQWAYGTFACVVVLVEWLIIR